MKLTKEHVKHIKDLFTKTLLFEKRYNIDEHIGNYIASVADYLIDDKIYTDVYEKGSRETPLLIPDVNFSASFIDDINEAFELTINVKNEKIILGENL